MSTYWDVECLTCAEQSGLHINHGEGTCDTLAACAEEIGALYPLSRKLEGACRADLDLRVPGESGFVNIPWFSIHAKHVLVARDEYGHIYGDCGEWSDYDRICRLAEKHEGDHAFGPRHEPGPELLKRRIALGRAR